MRTTRREFLGTAAAAGAALAFGARARAQDGPKPKGMKVLVLGGTGFLGPIIVQNLVDHGHTVTLFNRGKTNPQLFPDLEKLRGDREKGELDAIRGRAWDVAIDTPPWKPRWVIGALDVLKDSLRHYTFISSISVFGEASKPGLDESAPVAKTDDPKEIIQNYGALKALCEEAAEKGMPGKALVIRPGLIVGPGDHSDRFTYWPVRVERGGEVLAPGTPEDPVQIIDVRDLGEWVVRAVEKKLTGIYNATGPEKPHGMGFILDTCKKVTGSDAKFIWADVDFLAEQKVSAWSDMPAWVSPKSDDAGIGRVSVAKAVQDGLKFRPLEDTVRATLDWWHKLPEERRKKLKAGISPEREAKVLATWHERQAAKK
jgi:2'-hydroxyisoflavone reductase